MLRHFTRVRLIGFAIYFGIALFATIVNLSVGVVYREHFHLPFWISVVLAYLTGMVVSFIMNKTLAFGARKSGRTDREAIKFFLVSLVGLGITTIFSVIGLFFLNLVFESYPAFHAEVSAQIARLGQKFINRELFSNIAGIGFGFFANFFGHKFITFRDTGYWVRYVEHGFLNKSRRGV